MEIVNHQKKKNLRKNMSIPNHLSKLGYHLCVCVRARERNSKGVKIILKL